MNDLAEILACECAALDELAAALQHELELVRHAPQVADLEAACEKRQRIALRLLDLRTHRHGLDVDGSARTTTLWSQLQQRAESCRALNEHVGAFVVSRLHVIDGMLAVLSGDRGSLRYDATARVLRSPTPLLRSRA